jgi:hypothetical protein
MRGFADGKRIVFHIHKPSAQTKGPSLSSVSFLSSTDALKTGAFKLVTSK